MGVCDFGEDKPTTNSKEATTSSHECEWCLARDGVFHSSTKQRLKRRHMINYMVIAELRLCTKQNDFLSEAKMSSVFMKVLVRDPRQNVTKYVCTNWLLSNGPTSIN